LAVAEFAAYLALLAGVLQTEKIETVIALLVITYGAIAFTTRMGQHWFLQALRQNAYLFVAFELPSRGLANREESRGSNHRELWILAGRSEAFWVGKAAANPQARKPNAPKPAYGGSRIRFAGDLKQFLQLQLTLVATVALAGIVTLGRIYGEHPPQYPVTIVVVGLLAAVTTAVPLAYLVSQISAADGHGDEITAQWLEYMDDRQRREDAYVKHVHTYSAERARRIAEGSSKP